MSKVPRGLADYFIALLVLVTTWAIGIPRFASPDEPAHVYKAYGTAHGELLGRVAPGFPDNLREFDGPDALGPPNLVCYNGHPEIPASCATEVSPRLISSAARYPPWYYGLVGVPVAASGQADRLFPYRLVSGILCVALLALAMLIAKRSSRPGVAALQLAVLTPMALFLMGSVNPNAIEIAGFVTVWACLARVATDAELPRSLLILASVIAASIVLMRPIAIVWLAGVVVVVFIAANTPRRRELLRRSQLVWTVAPTAIALVLSWLWLRYANFEVRDDRADTTLSLATVLRRSIDDWGSYMRQAIGVLGWLDTRLPSFVYVVWLAALALVLVIYLIDAHGRGLVALSGLVVVWLALPLFINGFTNSRAGLTYQGRYSLPILVGLAFLPMLSQRHAQRMPRVSRRSIIGVVLALVVVGEVAAFWQMLRRFAVGTDGKVVLAGRLAWQPPIPAMSLIALNAVAMAGVAWSAWRPWGQVEAAAGEGHRQGAEHGAY